MTHAIVVEAPGGPEALIWREIKVGVPGPGEVRLRHSLCGVNYNDITQRSGKSALTSFPLIPGIEAVGTVTAVGPGAAFSEGDRVYYMANSAGCYAEARIASAERLVRVPDALSDAAAIGAIKVLTAQSCVEDFYAVQPGEPVLVHAAAGGVGLVLCQLLAARGAVVIGTVSTEAKAELAARNGCAHPIVYTRDDFVARVQQITGGDKVAVVYDFVGKDTFAPSLDCLRPLGLMMCCGFASGVPDPYDMQETVSRGSLSVQRPNVSPFVATSEGLTTRVTAAFDALARGDARIVLNNTYPLRDARRAHEDLAGRLTSGVIALDAGEGA